MAPNNKRRETTRRQLEQRLQERQQREATRKRAVLIGSVSGTVVVIAVVVVLIIVLGSGSSSKKHPQAGKKGTTPTATATTPTSAVATPTTSPDPTNSPCKISKPKGSVFFDGVTIDNPTDLTKNPDVTSCTKITPKTLEYKDLVVGKGTSTTAKSTVSVQYAGVFYEDGYAFDSSWKDTPGKPATFPLSGVVPGFRDAIGGAGKIPPMKIGGRRVAILPAALAYGSESAADSRGIPPNTPLVFVIDLKSIS